ncbi:amidase family protein, partial [Mycoplana ramosa]
GLVGLKPTRGAIPGGPHFGNHLGGVASELAVCRSVRDTRAVLAALRGMAKGPFADPAENGAVGGVGAGLRIGVLTETGRDYPTDAAQSTAVSDAAKALEGVGHRIVSLRWAEFEDLVATSAGVFADIVSVNLARLAEAAALDLDLGEPLTRAFAQRGQKISGRDLWTSLDAAVHVSHRTWALFESLDCLLMPMLSSAPLPVGSFPTDHTDTDLHLQRMTAFAPLASLANISGFPALTLPFGTDADGLPLPLQLMAPMGCETLLLSLAAGLEREGRWQHRFAVAGLAA